MGQEEWEDRRVAESTRKRQAIDEILKEREYQMGRWDTEHDKKHSKEEWLTILVVWIGKAAHYVFPYAAVADRESKVGFRKRLIQVAAICLAALEAMEES